MHKNTILIDYGNKLQELQNGINSLEYMSNMINSWIHSEDYEEYVIIRFIMILKKIEEMLCHLRSMFIVEKGKCLFHEAFFSDTMFISFNLIYPVGVMYSLFDELSYYSRHDYGDYGENEEYFFCGLLDLFANYISSIDSNSSDSGDDDAINNFYEAINNTNDCNKVNVKKKIKNKI